MLQNYSFVLASCQDRARDFQFLILDLIIACCSSSSLFCSIFFMQSHTRRQSQSSVLTSRGHHYTHMATPLIMVALVASILPTLAQSECHFPIFPQETVAEEKNKPTNKQKIEVISYPYLQQMKTEDIKICNKTAENILEVLKKRITTVGDLLNVKVGDDNHLPMNLLDDVRLACGLQSVQEEEDAKKKKQEEEEDAKRCSDAYAGCGAAFFFLLLSLVVVCGCFSHAPENFGGKVLLGLVETFFVSAAMYNCMPWVINPIHSCFQWAIAGIMIGAFVVGIAAVFILRYFKGPPAVTPIVRE